jgi:hypothetical protein
MVREIVTIKDYHRIAKENEYFLWHFVQKNQENNDLAMYSLFIDEKTKKNKEKENDLLAVLDKIDIPYFESYSEDSIDFLINLGLPADSLWKIPPTAHERYVPRDYYYSPIILGFHKSLFKKSTFETCYCFQGLIDLIGLLNPKFLLDSKLD